MFSIEFFCMFFFHKLCVDMLAHYMTFETNYFLDRSSERSVSCSYPEESVLPGRYAAGYVM